MNVPYFPVITNLDRELSFHIVMIGENLDQAAIKRPNGLPEFEWLHCDEGEGVLLIENNKYILRKGMGFFLRPEIPHEYYPITGTWKTSYVIFDGYGVSLTLDNIGLRERYYVFTIRQMSLVNNLIRGVLEHRKNKSSNKCAECSVLLYTFIIHMKDIISPSDSQVKSAIDSKLAPVISYLNSNYMKALTLEELSDLIDVTPSHLCRLFKQAYNIRPFEYLNTLRIEKSKELIFNSPFMPLKEIACSVGYNNLSYFCSVFKNLSGYSPTEFKINFIPN